MALTDSAIRTAKPQAKPYKLTDGGGLFLLVAELHQLDQSISRHLRTHLHRLEHAKTDEAGPRVLLEGRCRHTVCKDGY